MNNQRPQNRRSKTNLYNPERLTSLAAPVETERLYLIPLTLDQMNYQLYDYAALERSLALPPSGELLEPRLRSVVSKSIGNMQREPDDEIWYTYWVMVTKTNPRLIGGMGFKGPPDEAREVEIGYGVSEAFRNKGYITEAVRGLAQWAFETRLVASILAETANTNIASMRVVQKVGFRLVRTNPRFLYWQLRPANLGDQVSQNGSAGGSDESPVPADAADHQFSLYDLTVVVEAIYGNCTCEMSVGDCFHLRRSSSLSMPEGGTFCIWALNSVLPLLAARQRQNHPADWIESDSRVICPDPACGLVMRIDRSELSLLNHDDVSPIPWESIGGESVGDESIERESSGEQNEEESGPA